MKIIIKDIEINGLSIRLAERGGKMIFIGFPTDKDDKGKLSWLQNKFGEEAIRGESPLLEKAEKELKEYFAGERRVFSLPTDQEGTPFQESVWKAVDAIPYGETATYSDIASAIGREKSVRAVGNAVGANMLAILTPCHRIKAKNSPGGYAWGVDIKDRLNNIESGNVIITL